MSQIGHEHIGETTRSPLRQKTAAEAALAVAFVLFGVTSFVSNQTRFPEPRWTIDS